MLIPSISKSSILSAETVLEHIKPKIMMANIFFILKILPLYLPVCLLVRTNKFALISNAN